MENCDFQDHASALDSQKFTPEFPKVESGDLIWLPLWGRLFPTTSQSGVGRGKTNRKKMVLKSLGSGQE